MSTLRSGAALLISALLLAGCGQDDGKIRSGGTNSGQSSNADPDETETSVPAVDNACGALTEESVSTILGTDVTMKLNDEVPGGGTCNFEAEESAGSGPTGVLMVLKTPGDDLEDSLSIFGDGEPTTEPLEIDGAAEALLVDDNDENLPGTFVLATDGESTFTIYPQGVTRADEARIGTATVTALFGNPLAPGAIPQPPADVCKVLNSTEVGKALGVKVKAEPGTSAYSESCNFIPKAAGLLGVGVTLRELGSTLRIEGYVASYDRPGSTVTEVPESGVDQAFVILSDDIEDTATVIYAQGHMSYQLEVRAESSDQAEKVARILLTAAGTRP